MMILTVQLISFGVVMLTWLVFRRGTATQIRAEDALRCKEETASQTRIRHRLEKSFVSVFWIAVTALLLASLTGLFVG